MKASVSAKLNQVTVGKFAEAFGIDPRTGESVKIGPFLRAGEQAFSAPAD